MFFISSAALTFIAAPSFILFASMAWLSINFYFWQNSLGYAKNYDQFNRNNIVAALALSLGFLYVVNFEVAAMIVFADVFAFMLGFI